MIPTAIRSTADTSATNIRCLIYGRSGAGKTCLAATAPAPLILDAENGTLSLASVHVAAWPIASISDCAKALAWLATDPDARQFKTVILDSLTGLAENELVSLKAQTKDPRQAYGELADRVRLLVQKFHALPFHTVAIAKQGSHEDEAAKVTRFRPEAVGGKLTDALPYLFDGVFRLGIRPNKTRFLQTAADYQYEAKYRGDGLAPEEEPNLTDLFDKLKKGAK